MLVHPSSTSPGCGRLIEENSSPSTNRWQNDVTEQRINAGGVETGMVQIKESDGEEERGIQMSTRITASSP